MHQPHMSVLEGTYMTRGHQVVVSWTGSESDADPIISILNQLNFSFNIHSEDKNNRIDITVEADTMRGLRDAVDDLLVQLSSLED